MRAKRKLQPGLQLALGFLSVITIGALLLLLPVSQNEGENLKAIDALFISTSAVCVTGLTPVDISAVLSPFGTTVMMLLIQIGGLGYAVIAVIIIRLTSGKLDLSSRNLLRDSFGADHRVQVWKLLFTAVAVTAAAELIGAVFLFIRSAMFIKPVSKCIETMGCEYRCVIPIHLTEENVHLHFPLGKQSVFFFKPLFPDAVHKHAPLSEEGHYQGK